MMFRSSMLSESLLAARLPLWRITAGGPEWTRPLDAAEQSRADAIIARFAGLPDMLDETQAASARLAERRARWKDELRNSADLRPLLVVFRRLWGTMRQLHPALPPFADALQAVLDDLDGESA